MKTTADILNAAADLLESSPTAWIQHALAHDYKGLSVSVGSPRACSFCALGAIHKVAARSPHDAITTLQRSLDTGSIASWNDSPSRTREEVTSQLRKAANTVL